MGRIRTVYVGARVFHMIMIICHLRVPTRALQSSKSAEVAFITREEARTPCDMLWMILILDLSRGLLEPRARSAPATFTFIISSLFFLFGALQYKGGAMRQGHDLMH